QWCRAGSSQAARHRPRPTASDHRRQPIHPGLAGPLCQWYTRCILGRSMSLMPSTNDDIRILTPSGMLGYGFPVDHFKLGLALRPHAITIDSGSTDSGPPELGLGRV